MDHFTLSLAVGAVVGALDVIPMIFQNLSARSCFSAFFIYFFAAVIVFYSDLPKIFSLEEALEYIQADEYVEVTPHSMRLRKILLHEVDRKRASK